MKKAKRLEFPNQVIAKLTGKTSDEVKNMCQENKINAVYKVVDTCAAEFDATTPYYYSVYGGVNEVNPADDKKKIMVLGSGPIRIGQGIEFDYCSVHCVWALKEAGYEDTDGDGILDKDGENLSLRFVTYSYNTEFLQFADIYQAQLAELGVDLQVETYDVLDSTMEAGDFDIAGLNYAMAPTGNESYFTNMIFLPGASNNYNGYDNEKVDEIAETLSTTYDKEKRVELMKETEQEILNDGAYAFFANQKLICVYNKKVTGFEINPSEYYLITNNIDIAE